MDSALQEFATNGFANASLNRIIEASGISKGAMYYYFDGKEDLYADVIRRELERLVERAGALPVPETTNVDEYWSILEDYYLRITHSLMSDPKAGALLRDWLTGPSALALKSAQRDAETEMTPWLTATTTVGQQIGAIRSDLPVPTLISVALRISEAMDTWLITQLGDVNAVETVRSFVDMMRGALEPRPLR